MSSSGSNGASGSWSEQNISYLSPQPSMDELLETMPKRTLTEEDVDSTLYKRLRAMVDQEDALPPEHVPLIDLKFLLETLDVTKQQGERLKEDVSVQVVIERPQVFSDAKLENLSRLNIQDLMVRKRHKNTFLLVRAFCNPIHDLATGMLIGVEDPAGDFAYVKLFNHPFLHHLPLSDTEAIMPSGTTLAIREPTYSMNRIIPELPFVKVDSPSDVIFVENGDPILRNISWKGVLKKFWKPCPTSGEEWKAKALEHFKVSQWLPAAVCFTKCINIGFEVQVSRLNRSEIYLRLGWNNSALCDAQEALKMGTLPADLNKKAIIRMIKALYALQRYEGIIGVSKLLPNDEAVVEWVIKTDKRIKEQKTGIYDWPSLIKRSEGSKHSFDLANYSAPLETKTDANGLRGTYALRDMKAGELVMVENPLSTVPHKKYAGAGILMIHLPSGRSIDDRDVYHLFCETLRRIWDDEHLYAFISSLFYGQERIKKSALPHPPNGSQPMVHPLKSKVDIDVDMVYLAMSFNAFNSGDEISFYGTPSLLNHSCIPNTHREFFGNVVVVRALRDIKKGDEITIAYINGSRPYDERRYRLMNTWRFNCSCESCKADDGDRIEARETRRRLLEEMLEIGRKHYTLVGTGHAAEAPQTVRRFSADGKKICDDIRKTYNAGHGGPKFELADALETLTNILNFMTLGSPQRNLVSLKEVLELKFDVLEMRGLKVTDRSVSGDIPSGKKGKKRTIPINTSGISAEQKMCGQTVLELSHIFKDIGDMERSKRWFDAAVWMDHIYCGGDMESFKAHHAMALSMMGLSMHY